MDGRAIRVLRGRLVRWYGAHARELPWRSRPTPYRVLVSEAMLQQTQVGRVVDYFERFMEELPTVEALAGATEQRVLRLWQGLGYYRRARHLHAAAKRIMAEYGGRVPDSVEELMRLSGVGRYTAGAVASIGYGVRAGILDGNVARVLCRLEAIGEPPDTANVRRRLWELAERLAPRERPGDLNQAMMELGATVCVPRGPRCEACPVAGMCLARRRGLTGRIPVVGRAPAVKAVSHRIAAIGRRGHLLFEQRPVQGLWSRMWQMPTAEEAKRGGFQAWAGAHTGLTLSGWRRVGRFTHRTTHRAIGFELWSAEVSGGRLRRGVGQWRKPTNLDDLPMSNPQRRAVEMLLAHGGARAAT